MTGLESSVDGKGGENWDSWEVSGEGCSGGVEMSYREPV